MSIYLPLKDYISSNSVHPDHSVNIGSTWVFTPNFDNQINLYRKISLKNWWMGTLYHTADRLEAMMMMFWANFFFVGNEKE